MTFTKFSDAGRLYASNVGVVREMEKAYRADVVALLEEFERAIQRFVVPEKFSVHDTGRANRYWWLGDDRSWNETAYLYFSKFDPDELDHEGIVITAGTELKNDALLAALIALPKKTEALGLETNPEADRWNAFTLSLDFEGDDFIEKGARQVASVLKAVAEIERATRPGRRS
jgi:hypothetical protein